MYVKPTKEGIEWAMEDGWDRESAERGYDIFDFDQTGLLEVERIDSCLTEDWDVSDDDCAIEAERSGFCKIIPVEELPENFDRRYFGWIDTPENRKAIQKYCEEAERWQNEEERSEEKSKKDIGSNL